MVQSDESFVKIDLGLLESPGMFRVLPHELHLREVAGRGVAMIEGS